MLCNISKKNKRLLYSNILDKLPTTESFLKVAHFWKLEVLCKSFL